MTDTLDTLDTLDSLDALPALAWLCDDGADGTDGESGDASATSATGARRRPFIGAGLATVDLLVMGRRGHLVVHTPTEGPDADPTLGERLLERGIDRLEELEQRWGPGVPTGDIARANAAAGSPVNVHPDTIRAVARAIEGWRHTEGRFDITIGRAATGHATATTVSPPMVSAPMASATRVPPAPGCRAGTSAQVRVDPARSTITVPAGSAIDLGGIDKGLAADLVADELMAAGATGVLVSLGGDRTVRGVPNDDTCWYLGIADPTVGPTHGALVRLAAGGVATSRTPGRTWLADGAARPDPLDTDTGTLTVTVLAADAATADMYVTAAMTLPPAEAAAMLDAVGLAGLVVATDGSVHRTSTLRSFLA